MARVREILLPWDSQPQGVARLNTDHPLASRVIDFWIGSNPNVSNGAVLTSSGTSRFVAEKGVAVGCGAYAGTGIINLPNNNRSRLVGIDASIVTGVTFGSPAVDRYEYLWSLRDGASTHGLLFLGNDLSTYLGGRAALNSQGADLVGTSGSLKQDQYATYGCTFASSGRALYVNGAVDVSDAVFGRIAASSIQPALGNRQTGGRALESGALHFYFSFEGDIGAEWHKSLADDPYQLVEFQTIQIPVSAGGGPTPITATLAQTLADATSSATGTVALAGATAATLAPATLASAAKLALTGTTTATLANATLAATGTLAVTTSGVLAQTLADATVAATAALPIKGATTQTLANATASATAALPIKGTTTATLAAATLDAQGTAQAVTVGTLSATLADATVAATAKLAIAAVASPTLADAILAATATMPLAGLSGIVTQTLQDATSAATGTVLIKGSATVTLDACTIVAAGQDPATVAPTFTVISRRRVGSTPARDPGTRLGSAIARAGSKRIGDSNP